MTKEPLISIVIPTYNRAAYLRQAINSALSQDYPNFEVIVVDDGSTDETPQICAEYGEKIWYMRKKNGGTGSALNLGIRNMKGDWFKWLSSDDVLEPHALSSLLRCSNATKSRIVYSSYNVIDQHDKVISSWTEIKRSHEEFLSVLIKHHIGNGSSILIHKSCFTEVGLFSEKLRVAEDYDWWLRAAVLHNIRFSACQTFTLNYRVHAQALTHSYKPYTSRYNDFIRDRVLQQLKSENPRLYKWLKKHRHPYDLKGLTVYVRRKLFSLLPPKMGRNLFKVKKEVEAHKK